MPGDAVIRRTIVVTFVLGLVAVGFGFLRVEYIDAEYQLWSAPAVGVPLALYVAAVLVPAPFAWRRPLGRLARVWPAYALACSAIAYELWPEPPAVYLDKDFPLWPRAAAFLVAAVVLIEIVVVIPISRRMTSSLPRATTRVAFGRHIPPRS
jgi:hypothetical protein